MAPTVIRSRRAHRLVLATLAASAACLPGVAWAQCTAASATAINCSGTAAAYSNTAATGATVTVASGATVSAPLVIGTALGSANNVLNNSGTIAGSGATFTVQFGNSSTINNGSAAVGSTAAVTAATITSSAATGGAGAILVGNSSTVNNYGTLTAAAGTPAVQFGSAGTFYNDAVAPATISGNIVFGATNGPATSTFINNNTAYGLTGSVLATGNITLTNAGLWTGNFVQSTVGATNAVTFVNGVAPTVGTPNPSETGMTFSGVFATQDVTQLTNYGTMYLYSGSAIGSALNGTSSVVNNGSLFIGTGSSPALLNINGNFTQGANGTLSMIVLPSGASVATAGSTFSQLNAVCGSMSLGGTLALNITPGFYTTGSVFNLLVADKGISGQFGTITGSNLPFISFVPVGCGVGSNTCTQGSIKTTTVATTTNGVTTTTTTTAAANAPLGTTTTTSGGTTTVTTTTATSTLTSLGTAGIVTTSGTQQAYEFQVARNGTYHDALLLGLQQAGLSTTSVVSTNQLAIAKGLMPTITTGLVGTANAAVAANNLTDDSIAFVGQIDVLTIAEAQTFLDSVSPEGYLAYKTALHDQANAFTRSIALRMDDQNSPHDEDGWWFTTQGEYELKSRADTTTGYRSRDNLLGFVAGYDFSGPHHLYGLAMNVSWDALSYAPGSLKGHNRDIAWAAYGAYDLGPLVFSGQVAYNLGHLGASKTITLGSVTRGAHASAGEHLLKATGDIGFNLITGDFKLQPFVGIEYANGKVNSFTETSTATASDLTVAAMNANRTDVLAGVSFSRSVGVFRPYVRVAYRNQLGTGGGNSVSAYFNADPTTGFTVTGVPEARHELDANAGVNWVFDDAGALFIGAQATTRTAHTSVGLNLGVRLEF